MGKHLRRATSSAHGAAAALRVAGPDRYMPAFIEQLKEELTSGLDLVYEGGLQIVLLWHKLFRLCLKAY